MGVVYGLAFIAVGLTFMSWMIKIILIIAILAEGIYSCRKRIFLGSSDAIIEIQGTSKHWTLKKNHGFIEEIEPIQWISLFSRVILLRYRVKKKKIDTLWIFNDSTTPEAFHRGLLLSR